MVLMPLILKLHGIFRLLDYDMYVLRMVKVEMLHFLADIVTDFAFAGLL